MTTDVKLAASEFIKALERHVEQKSSLYDGITKLKDRSRHLMFIAEEAGEVASALLRNRPYSAVAECLDLAHSALLLAVSLDEDGSIIRSLSKD